MYDYKLLQALSAVIEEGGFEKAARALRLTQSAVSQRVRQLEEGCGRVLVARSSPPRPTAEGRAMLAHFRRVRLLEEDLAAALEPGRRSFVRLAVGVNADSLATWFFPAIAPFLRAESVLLEIVAEDQDRTHELLRDGEVLGCVSSRAEAFQGCAAAALGEMTYRWYATPEFAATWFPEGPRLDAAVRAPFLLFNRKDALHRGFFLELLGEVPAFERIFYAPSYEKFGEVIASGLACGMLPDQQAAAFLASGRVMELAPGHAAPVGLFWHWRNLGPGALERFSHALRQGAAGALQSP